MRDPLHDVLKPEVSLPRSKVFLVDDEPVVIQVLNMLLEDEGYELTAFDAGDTALEALKAHHPDVVVTDKNLPDLTGIDLIRLGKQELPDAEFIIVTGFASLESAIEAMDLGAFSYITKPFKNSDQVRQRVRQAVEKNRAVRHNLILTERLRSAYKELFRAKTEVEMMNDISTETLRLREGEIKAVMDEVLFPLVAAEADLDSIAKFVGEIAEAKADANAAPAMRGRAEMLRGLVGLARERIELLSESLEPSEGGKG